MYIGESPLEQKKVIVFHIKSSKLSWSNMFWYFYRYFIKCVLCNYRKVKSSRNFKLVIWYSDGGLAAAHAKALKERAKLTIWEET